MLEPPGHVQAFSYFLFLIAGVDYGTSLMLQELRITVVREGWPHIRSALPEGGAAFMG